MKKLCLILLLGATFVKANDAQIGCAQMAFKWSLKLSTSSKSDKTSVEKLLRLQAKTIGFKGTIKLGSISIVSKKWNAFFEKSFLDGMVKSKSESYEQKLVRSKKIYSEGAKILSEDIPGPFGSCVNTLKLAMKNCSKYERELAKKEECLGHHLAKPKSGIQSLADKVLESGVVQRYKSASEVDNLLRIAIKSDKLDDIIALFKKRVSFQDISPNLILPFVLHELVSNSSKKSIVFFSERNVKIRTLIYRAFKSEDHLVKLSIRSNSNIYLSYFLNDNKAYPIEKLNKKALLTYAKTVGNPEAVSIINKHL